MHPPVEEALNVFLYHDSAVAQSLPAELLHVRNLEIERLLKNV